MENENWNNTNKFVISIMNFYKISQWKGVICLCYYGYWVTIFNSWFLSIFYYMYINIYNVHDLTDSCTFLLLLLTLVWFMVINAIFNNISIKSWRSIIFCFFTFTFVSTKSNYIFFYMYMIIFYILKAIVTYPWKYSAIRDIDWQITVKDVQCTCIILF